MVQSQYHTSIPWIPASAGIQEPQLRLTLIFTELREGTMLSFLQKNRRLWQEANHGTAILEFAFVAPLLLVLLLSMFHFAYIMLVRHALEAGLYSGVTKALLQPSNAVNLIVQGVNRNAMGLFQINSSNVSVTRYSSIQNALNDSGVTVTSGSLLPADIVRYRVTYRLTYSALNVQ